jgi:hypothetical protein
MKIAGLDKAQILLALYNGARVHSDKRRLEDNSAVRELIADAEAGKIPFSFEFIDLGLGLRFIGVDLSEDTIKLQQYDQRHAYSGYGKMIINQLNVPMEHLSPFLVSEPQSPNAAALIARFGGVFTPPTQITFIRRCFVEAFSLSLRRKCLLSLSFRMITPYLRIPAVDAAEIRSGGSKRLDDAILFLPLPSFSSLRYGCYPVRD